MRNEPLAVPVAVPDDETVLVSPSQISTFACQRKWGFEKLHGLRRTSKAAEFGTQAHAEREQYLRSGLPIDQTSKVGKAAATGIAELDDVKDGEVEHYFTWPSGGGLIPRRGWAWHGYIDVFAPRIPVVVDHKFTGSPRYAKSEATLRADPQWNIYAHYALNSLDADAVEMRWLYVVRNLPFKSIPRIFVAEYLDNYRLERIAEFEKTSKEIEIIRRDPPENANELPANVARCGDFGGCPFAGMECETSIFAQISPKGSETFFKPTAALIDPCHKPTRDPWIVSAEKAGEKRKVKTVSHFQEKLAAFRAKQQAKTDPVNPPEETEETEEKPKRGRPPGARNKTKGDPEIAEKLATLQTDVAAMRGDVEEMKAALEALLEALA